ARAPAGRPRRRGRGVPAPVRPARGGASAGGLRGAHRRAAVPALIAETRGVEERMGDRGLIVVKQEDEVAAASVYVHWSGDRLIELLTAAIPRMRRWDASYSVARLVGVLHESIEGNTGLGLVEP